MTEPSGNPPNTLKQVVLELKYPPNLRVSKHICEFADAIGKDHSYKPLPAKNSSSCVNSPGYRFMHTRGYLEIHLFEDSLTIKVPRYPGFQHFRERALLIINIAVQNFNIQTIERFGLLYKNVFYFLPQDGEYPLCQRLFPHLNFDHQDVQRQRQFNLILESGRPHGGMNIRTSFKRAELLHGEYAGTEFGVYLLDLDAFHQVRFGPERCGQVLDSLHEEIKNAYNLHTGVNSEGRTT